MASNWYSCAYCGSSVKLDRTPSQSKCPKTGGSHYWKTIGEEGPTNFQCSSCGIKVNTKSTPQQSGCSMASSHSWKRV